MMLVLLLVSFMMPYESLIITRSGSNHLYHFANKRGGFWVNETAGNSRHFLMGFIQLRETVFSDYHVELDKRILDRSTAVSELQPHVFRRRFRDASEEVFMPDTLPAMIFSWNAKASASLEVVFYMQDVLSTSLEESGIPGIVVLQTGRKWNRFVAFAAENGFVTSVIEKTDVRLSLRKNDSQSGLSKIHLTVGTGQTRREAVQHAALALTNAASLHQQKATRLKDLVDRSGFESFDPTYAKALAWSLVSFDALNADEKATGLGPGIYAGYPWFQDYWGRDSFIALRALTVSGQAELARINLESFLKFQVLNDSSSAFGKVPNRVRPDESIYNTADATPRFIIEAWRYVLWTGDTAFIQRIRPNLIAAIRGTLKHRTDSLGLLVHNDADSWMDAVGPKGPYSPRGNRANDIQALWIDALGSARNLFRQLPVSPENQAFINELETAKKKANASFISIFVNPTNSGANLFDAVSASGKPDAAIRPNQLFAAPFVSSDVRSRVLKQVTELLGTPFGPMSLDPAHPGFHPFHQYEPVYEQDASYHNGIIWLWNTGEWVSQLLASGNQLLAEQVTRAYSQTVLEGVALGTLPELADAFPRKEGESSLYPDEGSFSGISRFDQMNLRAVNKPQTPAPPFSGTFSQAWSISEYLRNALEDYLGIKPQDDQSLLIAPVMPAGMRALRGKTIYRGWLVQVKAETMGGNSFCTVSFEPTRRTTQQTVFVQLPGMKSAIEFMLTKSPITYEISFNGRAESFSVNGVPAAAPLSDRSFLSKWALPQPLQFFNPATYDHKRRTFTTQTKN